MLLWIYYFKVIKFIKLFFNLQHVVVAVLVVSAKNRYYMYNTCTCIRYQSGYFFLVCTWQSGSLPK